jgi:hypothetical protein
MFSLSIDGFAAVAAPEAGSAPQLAWLPIADLVTDRSYQRDVVASGRKQILRIARAFDWAFFAPVIMAPVEGGRFAIIDGQHRTLAALLIGKDKVPCQIVIADPKKQARAFSAVNGQVTRMSALSTFRAALAGGDDLAVSLDALARRAGIRILGYPMQANRMQRGDCTCPSALATLRGRFGDHVLFLALLAVASSAGDIRGFVNPVMLRGLCMLFAQKPLSEDTVRAVFKTISLKDIAERARLGDGFTDADNVKEALVHRLARIAAAGRAA